MTVFLQVTENGFVKAGLRSSKFSIITNLSKNFFHFLKLQKKIKNGKVLRLEMRKSSTQEPLIPRFCKTDFELNLR
ncbi:hypothetical protein AP75_10235 [Kaistella haifensis DSM 19056]|uniref:Uncharacterized protein n=1 Tax=Kaistella haifensis DSM 19056 TaxID=1450526 RepID=A0A246B883_9FLAO|nr:hypothetical protein AP75_10235 [Kaistella haifensis DSM 19056]